MNTTIAKHVVRLRLVALLVMRSLATILFGFGIAYCILMLLAYLQYNSNQGMFGGVTYEWYNWLIQPVSYSCGGIALWLAGPTIARLMIRVPLPACPKCRYRLEGTPVDRCPECGLYLGPDFMDPPASVTPTDDEPAA